MFLGLQTDLNLQRFTVFSTDGVSGVKNLTTIVLDFVSCLWSDRSEFMAPFMVFNLWTGSGFILESCLFLIFSVYIYSHYYRSTRSILSSMS